MKTEWISCAERLPEKAGDYLILFLSDTDITVSVDIGTFYKAGDHLGIGEPEAGRTAEERLLDSILNRPILAGRDGFYTGSLESNARWEIKPLFWAELPDAPDGYEYDVL